MQAPHPRRDNARMSFLAEPPATPTAVLLPVADTVLQLLPEKAVWWPEQRTLFIADAHFGKAATFRAHGLPVPETTTQAMLDGLSDLLHRTSARHIVFLGDWLHSREGQLPQVMAALRAWRARHADVALTLVRGNHDQHAGDPPADFGMAVVDEPWHIGPLAACHHPQRVPGATVLAGHWHPAVHLAGRGRDRLRLPAFWHAPGVLVLPAFGAFTGTHAPPRTPGARFFAVGGGRVWALPD